MKKKTMFLFSLVIVLLVTFSTATYAAFSDQYHPRISNLSFNIKTQEYMMISKTGEKGSFKDEIPFNELVDSNNVIDLKPFNGVINGENIEIKNGETVITSSNNYIRFSLYFSSSNDMNLYLLGSESGKVVDAVPAQNGIFTDEQINNYIDSLRIGFVAYSTNETVTSSGTEISYLPFNSNIYSVNEKTDASYKSGLKKYDTFNRIYTGGVLEDKVLLNVKANKVSKMDIVIWLENDDINCGESIFNTKLQVYLRFFAVNVEGSGE